MGFNRARPSLTPLPLTGRSQRSRSRGTREREDVEEPLQALLARLTGEGAVFTARGTHAWQIRVVGIFRSRRGGRGWVNERSWHEF